jgi:hypothetical protein
MPQFGGMHIALPLDSHYSSWVSRRDNRAPLVSVCGGRILVVSVGDENQCVSKRISKVRCEYYYRVKCFNTYVWVVAKCSLGFAIWLLGATAVKPRVRGHLTS